VAKSPTGPVHVPPKQKMTSVVIINQLALTETLNEMKHELLEKAIESYHICHESSLQCTFIKSEFITLIFYLAGLLPFRDSIGGLKRQMFPELN
jgi:hypothetical protein